MGRILDPNSMMFLADRESRNQLQKTVNGIRVLHIASQPSKGPEEKRKPSIFITLKELIL